MSLPRMLKSQAIDAGSVRMATSARFSATIPLASSIFASTGLPASVSGCSKTAASGGPGRSLHTASSGFSSTATSSAPALSRLFLIWRTCARVISQGS